jgi:hypothetical protein
MQSRETSGLTELIVLLWLLVEMHPIVLGKGRAFGIVIAVRGAVGTQG